MPSLVSTMSDRISQSVGVKLTGGSDHRNLPSGVQRYGVGLNGVCSGIPQLIKCQDKHTYDAVES